MNKKQAFWAWLAHCAGHIVIVAIPLTVWATMFIRGCLNNGDGLFLWCFPPVFPVLIMGLLAFILKAIQYWAVKRFEKVFAIQVHLPWHFDSRGYEKAVCEKLRELALWLEEEFEKADGDRDKEAAEWRIRRAKNRFWSMWRLAKAMGFPVFRSWITHAQIRF